MSLFLMLRASSTFLLLSSLCAWGRAESRFVAPHFDATAAFADTRRATSFGERPPGSAALSRLRGWIVGEMKPLGGEVTLDPFEAQTPEGPRSMTNIIVRFAGTKTAQSAGTAAKAVVVTGHYDTLYKPMLHFVGANDAGSSTGFLTEFARSIAHTKHADDIYVVFFDGEEAIREWTATDSCYGSRHLVSKWGADGTLARIKALINIDMIGDKDLDVNNDGNSSQPLRELMWRVADKDGTGKYFRRNPGGIDDDHVPFVQAGVNALDIIDLDYGPERAPYWHTAKDTMDKLSVHSFQVVGDVVMGMLEELE